jgi:cell division protein DivIC
MMQLWKKILPYLKNKYILTLLVLFVWILFFDQNNLVDRLMSQRQIRQLESDILYFRDRIRQDSIRMNELKTDNENLEKFAREQYLMKRENEDIFVIEFED